MQSRSEHYAAPLVGGGLKISAQREFRLHSSVGPGAPRATDRFAAVVIHSEGDVDYGSD